MRCPLTRRISLTHKIPCATRYLVPEKPAARKLTGACAAALSVEVDKADRLRRELARGTLELAMLAVLASRRRYAYELLTLLNELTGGAPEIKEGTLYPLLHRLEDAGYISSNWEARDRNRPRKYYALTKSGGAQLERLRDEWNRVVDGMAHLLGSMKGEGR